MNARSSEIRYVSDEKAQVTKAFAKKAEIFGTAEFKLWREEYPWLSGSAG